MHLLLFDSAKFILKRLQVHRFCKCSSWSFLTKTRKYVRISGTLHLHFAESYAIIRTNIRERKFEKGRKMVIQENLGILDKLKILSDAAKYDVACTSSGTKRKGSGTGIGNCVEAGICHSFSADGRCISLLKILLTNECVYDCKYCINRCSNDVPRATFTPEEVCQLTIEFYRRNYIEGLFLSSGVLQNPNYTMELLYQTLCLLRTKYRFEGYIHVKAIPGASPVLIEKTGYLADRMSVNLELPTAAGQSTQMIIGATPENDLQIISVAESLYQKFQIKRVFYSAFVQVNEDAALPTLPGGPPLLREHRLYQADWLMRFYGFEAGELLSEKRPNFNVFLDPKCDWAIGHLEQFPVEVTTADYHTLLRVPGIGVKSAKRIIQARRYGSLSFEGLKKMGVVLKRAIYFITCSGRMYYPVRLEEDAIVRNLLAGEKQDARMEVPKYHQMSLFDDTMPFADLPNMI